ncbi:MAG: PIN domain-containing protein, partial [Betaproteobacteria bacterium]
MRLTYLLIDLENVHPAAEDMNLVRGAEFRVRIFHGPHQNKFDAEMVKAMQPLGDRLEFVQCDRNGKNALDFHIAFYLGRLVQECEAAATLGGNRARFFVVSKDAGFDALLDHIRSLGYEAARVAGVREALFGDAVTSAAATMEPAPIAAPPPRKVPTAKSA